MSANEKEETMSIYTIAGAGEREEFIRFIEAPSDEAARAYVISSDPHAKIRESEETPSHVASRNSHRIEATS